MYPQDMCILLYVIVIWCICLVYVQRSIVNWIAGVDVCSVYVHSGM